MTDILPRDHVPQYKVSTQPAAIPIPVRLDLRPEALAKSSRPTHLLDDTGVQAVASEAPGRLILRMRGPQLESLQRTIESGGTKQNIYDISTIEQLRTHEPLQDAFRLGSQSDLDDMVARAIERGRLLRIEMFPWIHIETLWRADESIGEVLQASGFSVRGVRGSAGREVLYLEPIGEPDVTQLVRLYGIRAAGLEPTYRVPSTFSPQAVEGAEHLSDDLRGRLLAGGGPGIVGVLDSGIDANSVLEHWVQSRETYDVGNDLDTSHGTFVAGLVLASKELNPAESCFGGDSAVLVDAQVMPAPHVVIGENLLLERITEVLDLHPEVHVWNCSLAYSQQLDPVSYSPLAIEFDQLSQSRNIIFIQAAGNYQDQPVRTWPPTVPLADGIACPAEAVNSIVVGALSHRGGRSPIGAPASYSRRGPGFGGQTKPDVSHWSGDLGPNGELPAAGIRSILPGDLIGENVGTSFAAPLVSATAANVWYQLAESSQFDVTPALVKGLLVHSASVNSRDLVGTHTDYYGAGVPFSGARTLFEPTNSFTTIHEVDLSSKIDWLRAPFPMPECLYTQDGKVSAEFFMTVSFDPLLIPEFGDESVRTCVEASFGVIDRSSGKPKISGRVPEDVRATAHPWEQERIAHGKWSPIRTHYNRFPQGTTGAEWGLKLSLLERQDSPSGIDQRVYVIITMRGLDDSLPVHADGLRAIQRLSLWNTTVSSQTSIQIDV